MTTAYRFTAIGDDEAEREIAIIGSLVVPPNSLLVMSIPRDTIDSDLARLRSEWAVFIEQHPEWGDVPMFIARSGDIRFACLTRVEAPE